MLQCPVDEFDLDPHKVHAATLRTAQGVAILGEAARDSAFDYMGRLDQSWVNQDIAESLVFEEMIRDDNGRFKITPKGEHAITRVLVDVLITVRRAVCEVFDESVGVCGTLRTDLGREFPQLDLNMAGQPFTVGFAVRLQKGIMVCEIAPTGVARRGQGAHLVRDVLVSSCHEEVAEGVIDAILEINTDLGADLDVMSDYTRPRGGDLWDKVHVSPDRDPVLDDAPDLDMAM
jgi:hypothetical protein